MFVAAMVAMITYQKETERMQISDATANPH
jgi:hypothetical protein